MNAPSSVLASIGVVVIGRNEGERLRRCLASVCGFADKAVYVDSGSCDGSVELARALGVEVVTLDTAQPFTAARARNAGFKRLLDLHPGLPFVQFVDGDCELLPDWPMQGLAFLRANPAVGLVSGRRRERYPERSIYNRLCDFDWDLPPGETQSCGGDFLVRSGAFRAIGGFRDSLIAGEEPELCVRLREIGWKIWRLDAGMSVHDAAMTRFTQWWKRIQRSGYAYSEGAHLHGHTASHHFLRQYRRIQFWGLALPVAILAAAAVSPAALWAFLLYPLQVIRIGLRDRSARDGSALPARDIWFRALFFVLGRFPEAQGCCRYLLNRYLRRAGSLIEYK